MPTGADILAMLLPNGGWIITKDDYESIQFLECEPITKKQFQDGFKQYENWKNEKDNAKAAERQAILDRIGLTADELQTILG
jgi:hypothetical protein